MCGIDDSKILGVGLPGQVGGPNLGEVNGPQQAMGVEAQGAPEEVREEVIDTSNHEVQPELPDAKLQEQLDRLMAQASETSFSSVSKEELEAALRHTHLTCVVEFHGKKLSMPTALQFLKALSTKGKVKIPFGNDMISTKDRSALHDAIVHAQRHEEAVNREVLRLQQEVALTMSDLEKIGRDYQELNDPDSLESSIVKRAVEAQLELGDKLMELINSSLVEDTAEVEVLQRKCMMRAVEINQLAAELGRLASDDDFKNGKPEVLDAVNTVVVESGKDNAALLRRDFVGMMSGMAKSMHGTEDALKHFQDDMNGVLAQLAKFQNDDPDEKALMQIHDFEVQISKMRQMLANGRKNGLKIGDGIVRIDEGLLAAMDKRLDEGLRNVRDIGQRTLGIALKKVIRAEILKFPLSFLDGYEELLKDPRWDKIRETHEKMKALRGALEEMCDNYQGKASLDKLKQAFHELKELTMQDDYYQDFSSQFMEHPTGSLYHVVRQHALQHPDQPGAVKMAKELEKIFTNAGAYTCFIVEPFDLLTEQCEAMEFIVNHIVSMGENFDSHIRGDELESNRMYDAVFFGKLPTATAVEARIHSVELEDVAQGTSDAERTKISRLGNGNCNTVYHCKYSNNEEYIYKPEIVGRSALNRMYYADGTGAFQSQQTILNLNVATCKCANLLGVGNRVVATKAGVVSGRFGLMMKVAPGKNRGEWKAYVLDRRDRRELKTRITGAPGGKKAVFGRMQRQMNELHWLDMLTGQIDRHQDNFKLDIEADGKVTVQGIDNDCCFGDIMVGVNTYELNAQKLVKLISGIKQSLLAVYGRTPEAARAWKKIDREILDQLPKGSKPGSVVVDLNKITNIFVVNSIRDNVLGFQTCALPDRISREMFDKLKELKDNPKLLEDSLKGRISTRALENAKVRLAQLWAHAEKLEQEHMVMETEDDWGNAAAGLKGITSTAGSFEKLLQDQGLPAPAKYDVAAHYHYMSNTCPDYFQRDYLSLMERVTA